MMLHINLGNPKTYTLECDVCGKRTDPQSRRTIETENTKPFELNIYKQSNGYQFLSMTCSKECRKKWEGSYLRALSLAYQETNYPIRLLIAHEK